jgi:hypothetical protein
MLRDRQQKEGQQKLKLEYVSLYVREIGTTTATQQDYAHLS